MATVATTERAPSAPEAGGDLPLVAIVTPVYNGGKYLRQAMESVQAQTYPNVVHVICNNASSDDSAAIIAEFTGRRVPIHLVENSTTLPLAANWEKAFQHTPATAKYAKLLCADDLLRSDAIASCVAIAEADARVEVVLAQDVFGDRVHRSRLPDDQEVFDGATIARSILMNEIGWLAFHHFFIRLHPDYRKARIIEDYWSPDPHVVMRSALRGKFAYIHAPIFYNRIHPDSVTGRELKKGFNFELVHMHLLNHFGRQALDKRQYEQALNCLKDICCRLIIRSRLSGHGQRTKGMRDALLKGGVRLRTADFLRAFVGWPLSSLKWRLREVPLGDEIDEAAFTRFAGNA